MMFFRSLALNDTPLADPRLTLPPEPLRGLGSGDADSAPLSKSLEISNPTWTPTPGLSVFRGLAT
jgi:hypothetical protein